MGASTLMVEADGIVRCDAAIASIKIPAAVSRMSNRIVALLVVRGPATAVSRRRGRSAPATTCFFPDAFFAAGRGAPTQRSCPPRV